ncbi:MAG TPA: RluA family pseudouridine synthase [Candidatus Fimadaptatus faecigallinarum]|uniref:Pseudouridine synthase n=1 Tax=Candidatus Fimadaptatus faecigallinarum TaxID=2840814 RepID=A0A9D1LPJ0_9FIRM|nr:RluA family pseudouridine synthase [Candidatus Fimadaptatus faecigallinarum]
MKELVITPQDAGKRLDRFLRAQLPLLSQGACQKFIRLGKIKLNGRATEGAARLAPGDVVRLYINDELMQKPKPVDALLSRFKYSLRIVYEDENLLLVDKRPGIMVHADAKEKLNTLVTHVRAYLYQKGEYDSMEKGAFAPAPCNRIDRFTGGIVIFAKNAPALHTMDALIRRHEVSKHYLCIALGQMRTPHGTLDSYILKPEGRRSVVVSDRPMPGAQRAITRYETLSANRDMSLIDCELVTGRTHQIRAQFAHAGHPLLGDGQYGRPEEGARFGREYQALYAYRIDMNFQGDAGPLNYLRGRSFSVRDVPFAVEYFGVSI